MNNNKKSQVRNILGFVSESTNKLLSAFVLKNLDSEGKLLTGIARCESLSFFV